MYLNEFHRFTPGKRDSGRRAVAGRLDVIVHTNREPRRNPHCARIADEDRVEVGAIPAPRGESARCAPNTTEEHLTTPWRFVAGGRVVSEQPRYIMIRDSVFNHLAHHRGQLTVYLRLNEALVPAIYGPSADERGF